MCACGTLLKPCERQSRQLWKHFQKPTGVLDGRQSGGLGVQGGLGASGKRCSRPWRSASRLSGGSVCSALFVLAVVRDSHFFLRVLAAALLPLAVLLPLPAAALSLVFLRALLYPTMKEVHT